MQGIGVALSGGGNRASLFNLGVLMYLSDAGKAECVRSIASVSGGSVANGYVAQEGPYDQMSGQQFEDAMRPFVNRIARHGTLWAWWGTWLYLLIVIALAAIVGLAALGRFPDFAGISHSNCYVGTTALVLFAWLFSRRNVICARAFTATLFTRGGRPTLLCGVGKDGCEHVFCATELHAGEHFYFSGRFVYSYRLGVGQPADIRLADPVQASANFPIAFPPRHLPTKRHCFRDGTNMAGHLVLVDGGVYDNMADQWLTGLPERRRRWPPGAPPLPQIDEVVVVNACTNLPWSPLPGYRIPMLGGLLAIKRLIDVLYDNTTTFRRKGLVAGFQNAGLTNHGLRGALVMLEQSPFKVPNAFHGGSTTSPEKLRADAVLAALGNTKDHWNDVVARNTTVKTTFRSLGVEASADLLYQGYVTAMANLHVILNYPLLAVPDRARFASMAG
jgi:hypothetical protein